MIERIKFLYWLAAYAVRPYDVIADRRRWFWQPRTPCGFTTFRR